MLNTTINNHESKVVAITKEIEKTISPDKVTEMYDAIKEEVEETVIRRILVEGNYINGTILELRADHQNRLNRYITRFVLNGKEYIDKGFLQLDEEEMMNTDSKLLDKLFENYKKVIGTHLLKEGAYQLIELKK